MNAIYLCEDRHRPQTVFAEAERTRIATLCDIDDTVYTRADLLAAPERFCGVRYVFSTWGMPALTEEEIALCLPRLMCVFYAAGTVQAFARPFLARGVHVYSAWAANAVPVAEATLAEILLANKGFYRTSRLFKSEGHRAAREAFAAYPGNYGETVGIIGAGMIGRLVIELLRPFSLRVLVFDPFLSDERAEALGVEKCDLSTLFERSFVVSNHLADNEATRGMLTYDLFARMRAGATFLNTGRGAQVVEEDLARVLAERTDLTAVLDVTYPEPPAEGHPFYTLPNCILTPHTAGSAGREVERMGLYMCRELEAFLAGDPCRYEITPEMLATMA